MDAWEQKLQLAESIAEHKFSNGQDEVFLEDHRDLAFFFFNQQEVQTTAAVTYALVNAYWNPNSKYLYIADDIEAVTHSQSLAASFTNTLSKIRPERKYQTAGGNVYIGFGETESEICFHALGAYQIGEDYDVVILDTSYHNVKLKHIMNFTNIIRPEGKLVMMSQIDGENRLQYTQNKLDAIIDDVELNCE